MNKKQELIIYAIVDCFIKTSLMEIQTSTLIEILAKEYTTTVTPIELNNSINLFNEEEGMGDNYPPIISWEPRNYSINEKIDSEDELDWMIGHVYIDFNDIKRLRDEFSIKHERKFKGVKPDFNSYMEEDDDSMSDEEWYDELMVSAQPIYDSSFDFLITYRNIKTLTEEQKLKIGIGIITKMIEKHITPIKLHKDDDNSPFSYISVLDSIKFINDKFDVDIRFSEFREVLFDVCNRFHLGVTEQTSGYGADGISEYEYNVDVMKDKLISILNELKEELNNYKIERGKAINKLKNKEPNKKIIFPHAMLFIECYMKNKDDHVPKTEDFLNYFEKEGFSITEFDLDNIVDYINQYTLKHAVLTEFFDEKTGKEWNKCLNKIRDFKYPPIFFFSDGMISDSEDDLDSEESIYNNYTDNFIHELLRKYRKGWILSDDEELEEIVSEYKIDFARFRLLFLADRFLAWIQKSDCYTIPEFIEFISKKDRDRVNIIEQDVEDAMKFLDNEIREKIISEKKEELLRRNNVFPPMFSFYQEIFETELNDSGKVETYYGLRRNYPNELIEELKLKYEKELNLNSLRYDCSSDCLDLVLRHIFKSPSKNYKLKKPLK